METNQEIEFKALLPEAVYTAIQKDYFGQLQPFFQTNHYFIDQSGILRSHGYSLRVRELNDRRELTLKKPDGFAKIEMNETLNETQYQDLLAGRSFPSQILDELLLIGLTPQALICYTHLSTWRYEKHYKGGVLCLDKSQYSGITDYEVEYEARSEAEGRIIFCDLLKAYQITYQANCLGKMTRAINAKTI